MSTSQHSASPELAVAGDLMPQAERDAFEAELAKIRVSNTSGPVDRRFVTIGVFAAVIGIILLVFCFMNSRSASDVRDQLDMVVLGLLGLGLIIFGSAIYLRNSLTRFMRYWLLRSIYEQRSQNTFHSPEGQ